MKLRAILILLLLSASSAAGLAQQRPARVNDQQVAQLLARLDSSSTRFRNSLNRALDRSRLDGSSRETELNSYVNEFDQAAARLRARFQSRQAVAADVEEVLDRGWSIDAFMRNNTTLNPVAQQHWRTVRTDLQTLARYYNVPWNWDRRGWMPSNSGRADGYNQGGFNNQLTGTYALDSTRSDDPQTAIERAVRGLNSAEAARVRASLLRRIEAPAQLVLEQRGRNITLASGHAPQVTLQADGVANTERRPNGRTVRTTASLNRNILTISSTGDRGSDFQVVFEPIENGRSLRVTRSFFAERLSQSAVTQSVYTRTSNVAQFNLYRGDDTANRSDNRWERRGQRDFTIPDGTRLTAVLDTDLTTKQSQNGDRFTLTVNSPGPYNGAVIEGTLVEADRSGRITGRAELGMDFQRIRLRNGRSYDFAGYIEDVVTTDGERLTVDTEGSVKDDDSQTERTAIRSGIGAALGAIIGGITGGGKGAAIGAAIGVGAGAGSVIVQGRNDLTLLRGTKFTIRASAPHTVSAR